MREMGSLIWIGESPGHYDGILFWHESTEETIKKYPGFQGAPTKAIKDILSTDWVLRVVPSDVDLVKLCDQLTNDPSSVVWFPARKIKKKKEMERLRSLEEYLVNCFLPKIVNSPKEQLLIDDQSALFNFVNKNVPEAKHLIPVSFSAKGGEEVLQRASEVDSACVVKVQGTHGGKGVYCFEGKDELKKFIDRTRSFWVSTLYKVSCCTKAVEKLPSVILGRALSSNCDLVVSEYVDTWSKEFRGYVNAAVYVTFGKVSFANARFSFNSFNIHAADSEKSLQSLDFSTRGELCKRIFRIVRLHKIAIEKLSQNLSFAFLRLDCLLDIDRERLYIAEIELKGGPGRLVRHKTLATMAEAGWDQGAILEYLEIEPPSIADFVRFVNTVNQS